MSNYSEIYDWLGSPEHKKLQKQNKEKEEFLYSLTDSEIKYIKKLRKKKKNTRKGK